MTEPKKVYLGVDPGGHGGIAVLQVSEFGTVYKVTAIEMPKTEVDIWDFIRQWSPSSGYTTHAVLEQVGGYHPGSKGNIGSRMFTFGVSYGLVRMALAAADIPCQRVMPQSWQKAYGLTRVKYVEGRGETIKGETDSEWKNRLKEKAVRLFPRTRVTLATADALLIAYYGYKLKEKS